MKNNKGVTLVALVITIIVLLILAGVSLAMLTGDSGILTNADKAKANTAVSNAKGAIEMAYMDIKTEVYALETANSSVQAVDMNNEKMEEIAKKYISEAGVQFGGQDYKKTVGGKEVLDYATLTITYPTDVDIKVATITYDPTPAVGKPRVELTWAARATE